MAIGVFVIVFAGVVGVYCAICAIGLLAKLTKLITSHL
jgi:hypothetical protein